MAFTDEILTRNKKWAADQIQHDADFFNRLVNIQKPKILWIGCADSRVAADVITDTHPGEMFVHRNIANMVVHTDLNMLSVLEYAVKHLEVEHVIVCGHYGCGGVAAALTNKSFGLLNKWLRNIKDVYRMHQAEVDAIDTPQGKVDRMVELNVQEQVFDLAKTSIIQEAWSGRKGPTLHGWVYRLSDGVLNEIVSREAGSEIEAIYRYEV